MSKAVGVTQTNAPSLTGIVPASSRNRKSQLHLNLMRDLWVGLLQFHCRFFIGCCAQMIEIPI